MKKMYLLVALLAFSSGAFALPCNPEDKDYDPEKCIFYERFFKPDERLPIDWNKIQLDPIPEPDWPFTDRGIPKDILFPSGVANPLKGI